MREHLGAQLLCMTACLCVAAAHVLGLASSISDAASAAAAWCLEVGWPASFRSSAGVAGLGATVSVLRGTNRRSVRSECAM
jgi:hypothetical protein